MEEYESLWRQSIADPEGFWEEEAKMVDWFRPYAKVWTGKTDTDFVGKWFVDGKLNVAYNCLILAFFPSSGNG